MTYEEVATIKIDDRVKCLVSYDNFPQKSWKGKVVALSPCLGIEWEKEFSGGHNCRGKGKNGFCREYIGRNIHYNDSYSILELVKNQEIIKPDYYYDE